MTRRILLAEDEESLILTLQDRLESEGYEIAVARDGAEASAIGAQGFDCILLDVALPKKNGFDVCTELRQRNVRTPILMLTARALVTDRVQGLKLGADDYLTKPFEMAELLARIEALLRRAPTRAFSRVEVDFERNEVKRDGTPIELSLLELKLLRYLIDNRGTIVTRDQLLTNVWGYGEHGELPLTRTVDVHVASLRGKLEENPSRPEIILTVRGEGYKFVG